MKMPAVLPPRVLFWDLSASASCGGWTVEGGGQVALEDAGRSVGKGLETLPAAAGTGKRRTTDGHSQKPAHKKTIRELIPPPRLHNP